MSNCATGATPTDDQVTAGAIGVLAFIVADVLHEGIGDALLALLTVSHSGTVSTVAWSSFQDSRLVEAGGTLVNLAAALVFWLLLRRTQRASVRVRFLLLLCFAFDLFTGTGYFFFSGVTNYGDWAAVIGGLSGHEGYRLALVLVGAGAYWGAAIAVVTGLVRHVSVPIGQNHRITTLTLVPYFSAVVLSCVAGAMNPLGLKYVFLSALPATAGALSGLLWMRYCLPRGVRPRGEPQAVARDWRWLAVSAISGLAFIFVLGPGIVLHR